MKGRSLVLATALLAIALSQARGQEAPTPPATGEGKAYTLRARYTVGELLKYRFTMDMSMEMKGSKPDAPAMPKSGGLAEMVLQLKTVGKKPDGTAVVVMQQLSSKMTTNGQETPAPPMPPVTMEISPEGTTRVRGMEDSPATSPLAQMFNMRQMPGLSAILPDHPIRVGDSWDSEVPVPLAGTGGTIKGKVTNTLLGVEPIGGQETLRIKQVMTAPVEFRIGQSGKPTADAANAMMTVTGTIRSEGINNMLPESARIVRSEHTSNSHMVMHLSAAAAQQSPTGDTIAMDMVAKMKSDLVSAGRVPAVPARSGASRPTPGKSSGRRKP